MPSVVLAATGTLTARPGGVDATCAALVSGLKSGEDFRELNKGASVRSAIDTGTLDGDDPLTLPQVGSMRATHRLDLAAGVLD